MADEPRDDELARFLAVDPLDDLTRRRLVRRALDETAADGALTPTHADDARPSASRRPARLAAILAAAAAVLVVLVVGVVALTRSADDTATVASRSNERALAPSGTYADASAAPSAGVAAADGAAGPSSLGEVGDLENAAARRRLLAAVDALPKSAAAGASSEANATSVASAGTATTSPLGCALDTSDAVITTGTGTYGAKPAVVVVTRGTDGTTHVRVVTADPCKVRTLR